MLNLFKVRTVAFVAMAFSITAATAASPDGDMERVESSGWVSAAGLDLNALLGLESKGRFDIELGAGAGAGVGVGVGVDATFIMTGSDPEGDAPSDVVYTPDGSKIVIAHRESRNLIVWDADTLVFIGAIPVSGAAQSLAITPDGLTAVVANIDNNTVSIVDMVAMVETAVIPVGVNPAYVVVSPAGDVAAVGVSFDSEIAVIDIGSASLIASIPNIGFSSILSFSSEALATSVRMSRFFFIDDDRVINADLFADEMQIVNIRTGVVERTAIADSARGIAVSGDLSRAAIAHTGATRRITLVDTASGVVIGSLTTPDDLFGGSITLNDDGTKGVVTVINSARVVDFVSGTFGSLLNTASINELLTTFDGRYAVGVGFRGAIIDMDTGGFVAQANNVVSTEHGAVSPVSYRAAMCSTTFGDDLVVINTQGAAGSVIAFQRTGPEVEGDRCRTVAVSPDGSRVVGVSIFSDNAAVIDTATETIIGVAALGERPSAVAISPDGTRAVVGNLDSTFATVIDLSDASSVNVNISRRAGSVVMSPDSQYAYVGVVASGDGVWRIDLDSNTVAGPKILTGNMGGVGYSFNQTSGMAISHDGTRLAVAGSFDNVVSIIDLVNWSHLADLPAGTLPTMVLFSGDDSLIYAANRNSDSVSVYDNSGVVPVFLRTFSVGDSPWHMVEDGLGRLWVNNWGDQRISAYHVDSGVLLGSVLLNEAAVGLAYDAGTNSLRVAHGEMVVSLGGNVGFAQSQSGTLTMIDAATLATTTMNLGVGPSALASSSDGNILAVAAPIGDGIALLNLALGCSAADLTGDGTLDFFDISAFLTAFGNQEPVADFTADGVFDFFDISAFLSVFGAGCP